MNEFEIIQKYFNCNYQDKNLIYGVGDDCALIKPTKNKNIAITCDAMNEEVHFSKWTTPESLATKLVTMNVSDLASCGAKPLYAIFALTLTNADEDWLNKYSKTFKNQLDRYNLKLIGGNVSRGNFNLTLTLFGEVEEGLFISREGAKIDDQIFVTGELGRCKLALEIEKKHYLQKHNSLDESDLEIIKKLNFPQPQLDFALNAKKYINTMIDISDGLIQDLSQLKRNKVIGFNINSKQIPMLKSFIEKRKYYFKTKDINEITLTSGEEYELLFTANEYHYPKLKSISNKTGTPITCIGEVNSNNCITIDNELIDLENFTGFKHF